MEKLILPIIKKKPPPAKKLSMDDYLKFVNFNLKFFPKNENKRKSSYVNVPFVLIGKPE